MGTFLSHFMAVSGGVNWWELFVILDSSSRVHAIIFIFYMLVMQLMVLNIITGIFVDDALELAQRDKQFVADAERERQRTLFGELLRLFKELDRDESGTLTKSEFHETVKLPAIKTVFGMLELDVTHAEDFFNLLDVDGSHELEIEEFVVGCMNLKGQAKQIGMETLMMENKRMAKKWLRLTQNIHNVFNHLEVH